MVSECGCDPCVPLLHLIIALLTRSHCFLLPLKNKDIPQIALQIIFMVAVPDAYSFVTIFSILCSFLSLLYSFFSKRNIRDSMDDDEAEVNRGGDDDAEGVKAADGEDDDDAKANRGDGATAGAELTVASDNDGNSMNRGGDDDAEGVKAADGEDDDDAKANRGDGATAGAELTVASDNDGNSTQMLRI